MDKETELANITCITPLVSAQKMHSRLSVTMVTCGARVCVGKAGQLKGGGDLDTSEWTSLAASHRPCSTTSHLFFQVCLKGKS